MTRPTLYFAHPISTYCSAEEDRALDVLSQAGFDVTNPSDRPHQEACGNDMVKWAALAGTCEALALLPFSDGAIGAGVRKEADAVWAQGKPLFELSADGSTLTPVAQWPGHRTILDVEQTRERLRAFRSDRTAQGLSPIPVREPAPSPSRRSRPKTGF